MRKTTIYFPDALKARVERVAKQRQVSEAEVIREAVDVYTANERGPRPRLPLFRAEPITDFDEALLGFGEK
jgi:hypothetical protein